MEIAMVRFSDSRGPIDKGRTVFTWTPRPQPAGVDISIDVVVRLSRSAHHS